MMDRGLKNIAWPGWETVRLIGRGSFGAVYEIQREVFGEMERAALKVISIPQNESDIDEMYSEGYDEASVTKIIKGHLESVVAEYTLMRKMNGSANVVNCEDIRYVQHDDGIGWDIFIKMELLTPFVKDLPQDIPEGTVVKIAKDMCNALILCKQYNIVHRDIKPQNIFISPHGEYKLGDFGIAKTVEKTMGGTKVGTYKYMAPEVYNNQPYGSSADIYSLGLVLYWLLNEKRLPFLPLPPEKISASADEKARHRRLSGEKLPEPKYGCKKLKAVVMKACAYNPSERFHSAYEMLEAINGIDKADSCDIDKESSGPKEELFDFPEVEVGVSEHRKKHWSLTLAASVIVIMLFLIVGYFTIHKWTAATCTEEETCTICGKTRSGSLGHSWIDATCTTVKTCSVCGTEEGAARGHKWDQATCITAKTCSVCGTEEGLALDHKWDQATCITAKTCSVCGTEEGAALDHKWDQATCITAKTCSVCGTEEGVALGHKWDQATCITAKTCSVCGTEEGVALGHKWDKATCTTAKICSVCGKRDGTPLGHKWKDATYTAPKTCVRCGLQTGKKKSEPIVVTTPPAEKPGVNDLAAINSPIRYPNSSSYLKEYKLGRIYAPGGDSVYGYYYSDAKGTNNIYFYPKHGEIVTVLAVENGRACVIVQSSKKACWVNNDYVVYY